MIECTITFTTNTAPLDAFLSLLEQAPNLTLKADDLGTELIRASCDADLIAADAGHYLITIYPSDRFLDLVAASLAFA